jgi:DNA-binding beta-propeller fold protein YncE
MSRSVWAIAAVSFAACSSTQAAPTGDAGSSADDVSTSGDGAADGSPPIDGSLPDVGTPPLPCVEAGVPPTTSFSLSAWPQLTPTSVTDLTASAAVVTTMVPGAPAGVVVAHDAGWVFAALGGAPSQLGVLRRQGDALTWDHGVAAPANATAFGLAQSVDATTLAMTLSDQLALYDLAKAEANTAGALLGAVAIPSTGHVTIDAAFSRDGLYVFAALEYDRSVAVVDVTKRAYVGAIPIAGDAVTGVVVSPDGARLYVTCEESDEFKASNPNPAVDQIVGSVTVVDVAKAEGNPATSVVGRAFVGRAPVRAVVSPDGASLWVSVRGSNAVLALDTVHLLSTTCNPLRSTTAVGPAPVGLAFVGGGAAVAVANSNRFAQPNSDQTVMLIDAAKALGGAGGAVVGQVTVGAFPREMDDDANALFVSNFDSQSVSGMNLQALPH